MVPTRITDAAMAILQSTPNMRLGITVLNKALFYADLCALRDIGKTITGSGYIALPQGPVVNHYERSVIRDLEQRGWAEQTRDGWERPLLVRRHVETFSLLNAEELGIAGLVARKIHDKSAGWVSEYSHENDAWQSAFRVGAGTAIDLNIAIQQVLEDDPWMAATADPAVEAVLTQAAVETGVPF